MASYHFSAQIIQRSKGRSAVAAAAYRSGSLMRDERRGEDCDFRGRRGVVWSDVLLPDGAAPFLRDRQKLWNHVERLEGRKDAQLAREINLALPHELNADQRRETLLGFVREAFVDRGMIADVAIHAPVIEKGENPHNHHAHIMLTLRRATREGLYPVKTREWNADALLEFWRALWSTHQNRALERANQLARVDHRSLLAQQADAVGRRDRVQAFILDRKPQIHVGPKASKITKRGRMPRSRDRQAGPFRVRGAVMRPMRRLVRYTLLDAGSRAAYRASLVERQKLRVAKEIQRWQMRAARARLWQAKLSKLQMSTRGEFKQVLGQQRDRWPEAFSLKRQIEEAARRLVIVRRRRGKLDALLKEIDRMLAGLLLSQGRGPGRVGRSLPLQSNNPRGLLVARPGRSRARYPIGLSIGRFDNA